MANPLNPLDWLRTAQDWFAKTERSSGFRPYLIFFIIACGVSLSLLVAFRDMTEVRVTALGILGVSSIAFILLFAIKSFQDPDFCRSETHLRSMKKLELEYMGSETEALPGEIIEDQISIEAPNEPRQITGEGGVVQFYLITFNRKAGESYSEFHAEFVAHPGIRRWFHYIRSSYVIGTELTASEISKHFRSVAAKHELPQRHLVVRVDLSDHSGFLPNKAWEWIRRQSDTIEMS